MADNTTIIFNQVAKTGTFGSVIDAVNSNFDLAKIAILNMKGKSAYEIWREQEGNENKSLDDFWGYLTADKGYTKVPIASESELPLPTSAEAVNKLFIFPNSAHTEYYTYVSNGLRWIELLHNNGDIELVLSLLGLCLTKKERDSYIASSRLTTDGNTATSSVHIIDIYNVAAGNKVCILGKTIGANVLNYAFYSSDELSDSTLISLGSIVNSNTVIDIKENIAVPFGATHLAISRYHNTQYVNAGDELKLFAFVMVDTLLQEKQTQIDNLNGEIDELFDKTQLQEELSTISSTSSKLIDQNGIPDNASFQVAFDVYSVTSGQSVKLKGKMIGSNFMQYAFYNTATPSLSSDVVEVGNIIKYSEVTSVNKNVTVPNSATHIGVARYYGTQLIPLREQMKVYLNIQSNLQELKEEIGNLDSALSSKAEKSDVLKLGESLSIREPQEASETIQETYFRVDGSNDTLATYNAYSLDVYEVTEGSLITIYGKNLGYKVRNFVFLNSSTPSTQAIVSKSSSVTNNTKEPITVYETVEVPVGATHIAISYYNNTSKIPANERVKLYFNVKSSIQELKDEIDNIEGGGDKTFSVTKLGSTITVSRKYNDGNIIITLSPSGPSSLVQLSSVQYTGTNAHTIGINTDWVGPYIVLANNNPLNSITTDFVGGWHSYTNTSSGVPTANTNSVKLYCDGELISENGTYQCQTCSIVVDNNIRGTNTKTEVYENGRDILNENVSYTFKEEDLFVKVLTKALEALRIIRYYGMQVSGFSSDVVFVSDGKVTSVVPDSSSHYIYEDTKMFIAKNSYNDYVAAEMFPIGIGVKKYIGNNSPKALVSGNKGYHALIYGSDCALDEGEAVFWSGRYRFLQEIIM